MIQLKCLPSPFILSLLSLCLFGCSKPEAHTTEEQKEPSKEPAKASTTEDPKEPAKELVKAPTEPVLTAAPVEGESFSIPDLNLDMLWCKPGTFQMGSRGPETQHKVTLTKGFYLGKHEVTQEQWEKVMGSNPSKFKGATLPVETIKWHDAMDFCKKLTQMEKAAGRLPEVWVYTLPTEAQWEYACRAGTTTAYSFGDTITPKQANYDEGKVGKTTSVGTYPVNAWGFHDLHGNVWEYCSDWYGDYPGGSVTDPVGPSDGASRVIRGGSWIYFIGRDLRSAGRFRYAPGPRLSARGHRYNYLGFRLSLQAAKAE